MSLKIFEKESKPSIGYESRCSVQYTLKRSKSASWKSNEQWVAEVSA